MRKLIILTILSLTCSVLISAQTNKDSGCPKISVSGPAGIVAPGELATFSARITNIDPAANIKYGWSASAGEIIRGQGTNTISVRQPTFEITVKVEIKGLPDGCPNLTSETEIWGDRPPQALKLGEISDLKSVSAEDLLDRVAQTLKDNPNAQLYILRGRIGDKTSETISTEEQVLLRRLSEKGIDKNQITIAVFAKIEQFRFWLVPPGANLPSWKESGELNNQEKRAGCPNISVNGPTGIMLPANHAEFTRTVTGDVPSNVTYAWTVSDGEIVSGRNDLRLKVRITDSLKGGGNITATLEVLGLPKDCSNIFSTTCSFAIDPGPIDVDEFGPMSLNEEYALLKRAATRKKNYPNSILYMVKYPRNLTAAFRKRNRLLYQYASSVLHIRTQFRIVVGPKRDEEVTKIYIVPVGVPNPQP